MVFSIIIPVYNVEAYLPECVESVLSQSYKNIEVILVDDGSPDNSGCLCDKLSLKDNRIKVIHKSNGGLSDARNAGLEIATGDYVLFLDSDDFWTSRTALEKLSKVLEEVGMVDFICFNCSFFYPSSNVFKKNIAFSSESIKSTTKEKIFYECIKDGYLLMSAWSKVVKREFLIENKLYFKKGIICEDIPWSMNLFEKAKSCCYRNIYLYGYRKERENSITSTFSIKVFDDLLNIIRNEIELLPNRNYEDSTKDAFMSLLAYEFCILLARINSLPSQYHSAKRKELLEFKWLLNYKLNPKVKSVKRMVSIIGISLTEKFLNFFIRRK